MKRIISCLLAILLLVSASFETSVITAAEDASTFTAPTFTVSNEKADPGEDVSVTIRIVNNPGIASVKLKVQFDSDLILSKITYNTALGGRSQQPETLTSPATLNWFNGAADTVGDMTYAVLDFTVADDAMVGMHPVTITYDEDDAYNIAEENIAFDIADGGVDVVISVTGLDLDHTAATAATGDRTFTLTPVFTPSNATNQKVTWKSSDTSVATVDGGVVTLLKKGETVITAVSDDGGFEAACALTVLCSHLTTEDIPAEASTCIKQGHEAYTICLECGEIVSGSDALLPFAEHQFAEDPQPQYLKSAATCVSPAIYYKSCSVCGIQGTETFEYGAVDPHNHVGGTHPVNRKKVTCSEPGYTGDTVCNSCGAVVTYGEEIPMIPHTPGEPVRENEVAPSCKKDGSYDEVVYCTVCGAELSREKKTVPATGHSYGAPVWTWRGFGSAYAAFFCTEGDDQVRLSAAITFEITKEPSFTEEGERTYRASVTFMGEVYTDVKTEAIPKWYILGDVDHSGEAEITDATWIQRHKAGMEIPFTLEKEPADVDGDGEVTLMDATWIQYYLAVMNTTFDIGKLIN